MWTCKEEGTLIRGQSDEPDKEVMTAIHKSIRDLFLVSPWLVLIAHAPLIFTLALSHTQIHSKILVPYSMCSMFVSVRRNG